MKRMSSFLSYLSVGLSSFVCLFIYIFIYQFTIHLSVYLSVYLTLIDDYNKGHICVSDIAFIMIATSVYVRVNIFVRHMV